MEFATRADVNEILSLYGAVIEKVNTTSIRLGWDLEIYPNASFVNNAVLNGEM